jgi:hypothetical protein
MGFFFVAFSEYLNFKVRHKYGVAYLNTITHSTVTFVHLYDWETGHIFWENPE